MAQRFEITNDLEVDATPEQVWDAIATGPGMDSWFMGRSEVEPRQGGTSRWSIGDYTETATVTDVGSAAGGSRARKRGTRRIVPPVRLPDRGSRRRALDGAVRAQRHARRRTGRPSTTRCRKATRCTWPSWSSTSRTSGAATPWRRGPRAERGRPRTGDGRVPARARAARTVVAEGDRSGSTSGATSRRWGRRLRLPELHRRALGRRDVSVHPRLRRHGDGRAPPVRRRRRRTRPSGAWRSARSCGPPAGHAGAFGMTDGLLAGGGDGAR